MSLTIPTLQFNLGGSPLTSADILGLSLHLGCTNEVSSFTLILNNTDGTYSPGEAGEPTKGAVVVIYLKRGSITGSTKPLFTGRLERVIWFNEAEEFNYRDIVTLQGRCKGHKLFRRHFDGDLNALVGVGYQAYKRTSGEASSLVAYLIDNHTSLTHTRVNSAITASASSAQKNVTVTDGTKFTAGDLVKILDGSTWEYNKVDSVAGNVVTMVSNLVNSYTATGFVYLDLIRDTNTTYTKMIFTYEEIFGLIKFIADTASTSGGDIGYDFRVEYDGNFAFLPRGSIVEPYSLAGECTIEEQEGSIQGILNKIWVFGKEDKAFPEGGDWVQGVEDNSQTDSATYDNSTEDYVLATTITVPSASADKIPGIIRITYSGRSDTPTDGGWIKVTTQKYGEAETILFELEEITSTDWTDFSHNITPNEWASAWETGITVRFYTKQDTGFGGKNVQVRNCSVQYDTIIEVYWAVEGDDPALAVDGSVYYGNSTNSLKLTLTASFTGNFYLSLYSYLNAYINVEKQKFLKFAVKVEDIANVYTTIRVRLIDNAGLVAWQDASITKGSFTEISLATDYISQVNWTVDSGFNFAMISAIRIYSFSAPAASWSVWIDSLFFGYIRWSGFAEDAVVSQPAYDIQELIVINDLLLTDLECETKAESLLAYYKDPRSTYRAESISLDWGDYAFSPGNKVGISYKISPTGNYRIDSIDIDVAEDNKVLLTFILDKTPPRMANYLFRLKRKLDYLSRAYNAIR